MLGEVADHRTLESVIAELEAIPGDRPEVVSALWVLKNELEPLTESHKRAVLFDRSFALPGSLEYRLEVALRSRSPLKTVVEAVADLGSWLIGTDYERFRDRCDRYFWREMVPRITESFGSLADPVLNTINEAIINYAEYSFKRWCLRRRVHVHLFRTDDDLAYAIIRPSGTRLRAFDPLSLKTRVTGTRLLRKRGWGHTLLMERALFLSFDRDPHRRGMLVVVGRPRHSPESHSAAEAVDQLSGSGVR